MCHHAELIMSPLALLQLCNYGVELLKQVPETCRNEILLGTTDLRKIRFLRIIRNPYEHDYRYELSEEMDEVLAALCTVMEAGCKEVGFQLYSCTCISGEGG